MLGNVLGALVALFGLFGVGAVVCAIVWTFFAWSGRWYDWLLSFVTPLGLASITTCVGWGGLSSPACNPSIFWAIGQSRHEGGKSRGKERPSAGFRGLSRRLRRLAIFDSAR